MQFAKLQNGSDIRGVAIQTEGGRSVDLTPDAAYAIGRAFARVLKAKLNKDDIRVCMGAGFPPFRRDALRGAGRGAECGRGKRL